MSEAPKCSSCAHWMGDALDRRRKARYGECVAAKCFVDVVVTAPPWCHDCDPYGMNEVSLRTREDFSCKHYVIRGGSHDS